MKTYIDPNGNKTLAIFHGGKTIRIQTNGNLPYTHRNGVGNWTLPEVIGYLKKIS